MKPDAVENPNPPDWISLIETTTREVFITMVGVDLRRVPDPDPPLVAEMTAMLGLAGELCGVISVHCAASTVSRSAARVLGAGAVEPEFARDMLAEICNVIAGNFKCKLPELSEGCLLSLPTVISGAEYQIYSSAHGERFQASFECDGAIWITLDLEQNSALAARPMAFSTKGFLRSADYIEREHGDENSNGVLATSS